MRLVTPRTFSAAVTRVSSVELTDRTTTRASIRATCFVWNVQPVVTRRLAINLCARAYENGVVVVKGNSTGIEPVSVQSVKNTGDMKTWRELAPDEQAELLLSGARMCEVCGGHGTITRIPSEWKHRCFCCEGKGYGDPTASEFRWWRNYFLRASESTRRAFWLHEVQRLQRPGNEDASL